MSYLPGGPGCEESSRALQKNTVHLIRSSHPHHMGTLGGRKGGSFLGPPVPTQLSHLQIVISAS